MAMMMMMIFPRGLGEDDSQPRLFFVLEGSVEILIKTNEDKMMKIKDMEAPFYLGEVRVFQGGAATATVRTLTACEVLTLDKEDANLLSSWGNEAIKLIEREMLVRALERKLTATSGGIFSGLKTDPLFMSSILAYTNRTHSAEQLHFIFAAEELKHVETIADALELVNHIWQEHVEPDVSSEEARQRSLKVEIPAADLDRLRAEKAALVDDNGEVGSTPLFDTTAALPADSDNNATANTVTLDALKSLFDAVVEESTANIKAHVIPEFMRSDEYEDFLAQMFPLPDLSKRRSSVTLVDSTTDNSTNCQATNGKIVPAGAVLEAAHS